MAGGNAIRGTRIGSAPTMGESEHSVPAPRISATYWCASGHATRADFAAESLDQAPATWECALCGLPAGPDREAPPQAPVTRPYKTHLAYVKERRSDDDGAVLLDEALANLRKRRGPSAPPLRSV